MTIIGTNIKQRREELGLTQEELAKKMGYKSKSTINKIEAGINDIAQSKVAAFAKTLGVTPSDLMGWTDVKRENIVYSINVYDHISDKATLKSTSAAITTAIIPEDMGSTGTFFGLLIHDNSMSPRILDGDTVIVRLQDDAEAGDIVIALINGETVCRRFKQYNGGIMLLSDNPEYEPVLFPFEEISKNSVEIIGRVVELRSKF